MNATSLGLRTIASVTVLALPTLAHADVDPRQVCRTTPNGALTASREAVIEALLKENAVTLTAADLIEPIRPPVAPRACSPTDGRCKALNRIGQTADEMLRPADGKRIAAIWIGSRSEPTNREERLAAFFDLRTPSYELRCASSVVPTTPTTPVPTEPPARNWITDFHVAQDLDNTYKPLGEAAGAKVAYKSDRSSGSSEYSIKGVVRWTDIFNHPNPRVPGGGGEWIPRVSPYIAIDRVSSPDPAKTVDDLTFGVRLEGRLPRAHPFYLTGSWTTDTERFDSSVTKLEFKTRIPFIPSGYIHGAVSPDRITVLPVVNARVVADYINVADPGEKKGLIGAPDFARVGLDVEAALRIGKGMKQPSVWLKGGYRLREYLSGVDRADVDLWDFAFEIRPTDDSPFSLVLGYQRGHTLETLTEVDTVTLGIGYKR